MDLIKEALSMGFADAAIMDTKDLVFVPEYRQFCEDNLCGNYNLVPACPPTCGTVEEMQAKALKYEKALVLQTVLKDPIMDPVLFKQAKHAQNILTEQLARQMHAHRDHSRCGCLRLLRHPHPHHRTGGTDQNSGQ